MDRAGAQRVEKKDEKCEKRQKANANAKKAKKNCKKVQVFYPKPLTE